MSGRVYSYTRFSDPRQASGHSSERQAAYAARWAAERGLTLDDSLTLRDEGLSAYHQHHIKSGALGLFLVAVEAGRIPPGSVLVVEGLDRLSRAEPIQAQAQLAQIVNAGITVVTASDGREYSREHLKANPMDLVYSLLVMIRAHEESDTKSKRVKAAIRKQCEGWIAGTYRGIIRNGKDPSWLRWDGQAWQEIPERVEAVRLSLDMFRRGYGASRIVDEMERLRMGITSRGSASLQIYRLVRQHGLVGDREITVDGQTYILPGYYPPLLTRAQWAELQTLAQDRGRRKVKGSVPHVLSGLRIAVCGYCGSAMIGQNMENRRRTADGRIPDAYRRMRCSAHVRSAVCPVKGSAACGPLERAITSYCSDMINLQALFVGDRAAAPREALGKHRTQLAAIDTQLERLTDAMLAASAEGVPATFARRARDLEAERDRIQAAIVAAEHELSNVARSDLAGTDQMWRELAAGMEAQDYDARIRARQLVADTFERIVIYSHGLRPGQVDKGVMDVLLMAKGGSSRMLRIDQEGRWIAGEQLDHMA